MWTHCAPASAPAPSLWVTPGPEKAARGLTAGVRRQWSGRRAGGRAAWARSRLRSTSGCCACAWRSCGGRWRRCGPQHRALPPGRALAAQPACPVWRAPQRTRAPGPPAPEAVPRPEGRRAAAGHLARGVHQRRRARACDARKAAAARPPAPSGARGGPGKSTLLNRLTAAGVLAEDKLFATLDPTTRRLTLPSGKEVLLTDTVGFIQVGAGRRRARSPPRPWEPCAKVHDALLGGAQKLPTQLIAAFQATLEEIESSTLLMHIVDVSHPNAAAQSASVLSVRSLSAPTASPAPFAISVPAACIFDPTSERRAGAVRAQRGSPAAGADNPRAHLPVRRVPLTGGAQSCRRANLGGPCDV